MAFDVVKFYYNKKHYGYLNALYKVSNNLISAILNIFFSFTFNRHQRKIYFMRLSGLFNSIIGKSSGTD